MVINQYEVYWINLDSTIGAEVKKTRPCLVISPNEMNHNINTVLIAPLTSKMKSYPSRIKLVFENRIGWVMLDQIRCVDKKRLIKLGGMIGFESISNIKKTLKEMLVD